MPLPTSRRWIVLLFNDKGLHSSMEFEHEPHALEFARGVRLTMPKSYTVKVWSFVPVNERQAILRPARLDEVSIPMMLAGDKVH